MRNGNLIIGINLSLDGSTGTIMMNSLEYANQNGGFNTIALVPLLKGCDTSLFKTKCIPFKYKLSKLQVLKYRVLEKLGFQVFYDGNYYREDAYQLIKIIKANTKHYNKTIVHLHNIHGCNINVNILYKYLSKTKFNVFYTLHDCWPFTGGCYYYSHKHCNEWQTDCGNCIQNIICSKKNLKSRTKQLRKIKRLILIPCSYWLNNELKLSKLSDIKSIVNHGETNIKRYPYPSDLKDRLNIKNKKILITVSSYWVTSKGKNFIYKIADILPSDYLFLVVGGDFDVKNYNNILHIPNISRDSLSEYFSISDVFVSLTQADNLPLVLMEAQICGVPVVGFGHGGTKETVVDGKSGIIVGTDNNVNKMVESIIYTVEAKPFKKSDIIESGKRFSKYSHAKRMLNLYLSVINKC